MSSAERPELITFEQSLAREEQSPLRHEYIDGWVRGMTGSSVRHNQVKTNCVVLLGRLLRGQRCRPFDADMKLRVKELN